MECYFLLNIKLFNLCYGMFDEESRGLHYPGITTNFFFVLEV